MDESIDMTELQSEAQRLLDVMATARAGYEPALTSGLPKGTRITDGLAVAHAEGELIGYIGWHNGYAQAVATIGERVAVVAAAVGSGLPVDPEERARRVAWDRRNLQHGDYHGPERDADSTEETTP